jgi:hypothetical protein
MPGERLEFNWGVPAAGFRWVQVAVVAGEALKQPQPALVTAQDAPVTAFEAPAPSPQPDPALFRIFGEVEPNKEGVLALARTFGNLHDGVDLIPANRADAMRARPLQGVTLDAWQHHISGVQRLVGVWDLLRQGDAGRLAPHIRWHKDKKEGLSVRFDSHPAASTGEGPSLGFRRARAVIASRELHPELLTTFTPEDPLLPAWVYLRQDLDCCLYAASVSAEASMAWDLKRRRPLLRLAAPTLLMAVWFQLADAVSNDRAFSRCRECGKWFEVAPDAARTHRRFCSSSCRSKSYRQRQDRARRLHAAGTSFEEIARELDSDVPTVRKWITGQKE